MIQRSVILTSGIAMYIAGNELMITMPETIDPEDIQDATSDKELKSITKALLPSLFSLSKRPGLSKKLKQALLDIYELRVKKFTGRNFKIQI